jgi:hypothetical protein
VLALAVAALSLGSDASAQPLSCRPAVVTPVSTIRLGPEPQDFSFGVDGTGQPTYQCVWIPLSFPAAWLGYDQWYFAPGGGGFFGNFRALVPANTLGAARTGAFTFFNGMGSITIIQEATPCAIAPAVVNVSRAGGFVTIPIQTTMPDCGWSLGEPSGSFVNRVGPPAPFGAAFQGVGPGAAVIAVASNETGTGPRSTSLQIAGVPVRIDQEGPLCVFTMTPVTASFPAGGGSGTVSIGGTGTDCSYSTSASANVSITGGSTGVTPATIVYTVAPTTSQGATTASITVGGATLQISQAGPAIATDVPTSSFPGAPSGLSFAHYRPSSGPPFTSPVSPARLTNTTTPNGGWTASADQPWVTLSRSTGTTPAMLGIAIDPAQALLLPFGTSVATVSVASANPAEGVRRIPVSLFVANDASTTAARGWFDTPTGSETYSGAIPVTGWALDDVGIARVVVSRDAVAGETPGTQIYVADAVRVRGARPDVARLAVTRREGGQWLTFHYPESQDAGWGYMLLSNALPGGGNGAYTLHVDAIEREGRTTRLGTRIVTFDNAHATRPFGTIDFPAQGGTVSGTIVNLGWALTPAGKSIPVDGSTINVYIDGVLVGPVTSYNHARPDVTTLFPGLANSDGPGAQFSIDTTTLADGVHTIVWVVSDDAGVAEGIGSRYFTVQNGGGSQVRASAPARAAASTARLPSLRTDVWSREGVDDTGWAVRVETYPDGSRRVTARQGQRLEIFLDPMLQAACGTYDGHLLTGDVAGPLPMGASLERQPGIFRWQPGPEVAGDFVFVFVQRGCDGVERRISVDVLWR